MAAFISPANASIDRPCDLSIGPDGGIFFYVNGAHVIRKVAPAMPGYSAGEMAIPSETGNELFQFDAAGRHLRTVDALTGTTLYEFHYENGLLNTVTDSYGNITEIERDDDYNPTAIIGPYGHRTEIVLNDDGYLEKLTDPASQVHQFTYHDHDGLLATMTDPRGNTYQFTYDEDGRLIRDDDPDGGFKELVRTDNASGYDVWLKTAMNQNKIYKVEKLPTGGRRLENKCCGADSTVMEINLAEIRTITRPDGTVITRALGPDNRWNMQSPIVRHQTITTPNGLSFDLIRERQVELEDPADPLTLQHLTETVTINGNSYETVFDADTRQYTYTSPLGRESKAKLNEQGRLSELQIPGLLPIHYTYDSRGRLETVTQGTRTHTLSYNAKGELASFTNPLSHITQYEYDTVGRLTKKIFPDNRELDFTYDGNSNQTSLTPPGQSIHTFEYTKVNLEELYVPPEVGAGANQTQYAYNKDRQLTQVIRPDGQTIDLDYDGPGRLSRITIPRGQIEMAYVTKKGNLKTITAPDNGTITYEYDGNLPIETRWSGVISGSVHHGYDNNLRIKSQSVNDESAIVFQYDSDGLLKDAGALSLKRYAQNGLLDETTLGSVSDKYGYNDYGEIETYTAAVNETDILALQYDRDARGKITHKTETLNGETHTYSYIYDDSGQLTEVKKDDVLMSSYTYDDNGNRLTYTDGNGNTISGSHDAQDRLLSYGSRNYTYTANGELQTEVDTSQNETTQYEYDVLGNLLSVTLPDSTHIEYVIDGRNRRIGKKVNGTLVQGFLYRDKLNPMAELDGDGNVISTFVYGTTINAPDYMVKGGITYRIITDHLGSPRLIVEVTSGEVVQELVYDEFGRVIKDTNPGFQPFGFAGGIYDQHTKLTRFGARDYSSLVGRWTTKDPIGFAGRDTNLYVYVENNPVTYVDPTGTAIPLVILVAGVVFGAASGTVYSITSQVFTQHLNYDSINWNDVLQSAVGGALVGAVSAFLPFVSVAIPATATIGQGAIAGGFLGGIAGFIAGGFHGTFSVVAELIYPTTYCPVPSTDYSYPGY